MDDALVQKLENIPEPMDAKEINPKANLERTPSPPFILKRKEVETQKYRNEKQTAPYYVHEESFFKGRQGDASTSLSIALGKEERQNNQQERDEENKE
ncbi:hypothetical protein CHS0354_030559 [Potamilus streckersoni]|uniref:Uncharacterized protein n=1 Tax=Potamilus streckersoni TaxID=2493646 RepID=A0AAE0S3Q5_9BIVA|nr:hypothetical protein CHS0354_030559 [Potamilus streckersoni]